MDHQLIINLSDISYAYPGGSPVLDGLDLEFIQGQRIGLIGANGSGKTTLFHLIMGLIQPISGKIEIFGKPALTEKDFRKVREKIGLLFQDPDDQLFSPTVLEDVAFGPLNLGKSRAEAIEIAKRTLDSLGLGDFEDRITYKLSGGEKRLVSLATILAMEPTVLLLDEPTNGLDERTRTILNRILSRMDLSYILISHEMEFLAEMTDAIYLMDKGKILTDSQIHVHQHIHAHRQGTVPHKHE